MEWYKLGAFSQLDHFDPNPYLDDPVFQSVKLALEGMRKSTRSINTFSDALAIAILAKRTRDFQLNPARAKLSLFFDHAGELAQAVRVAGVQGELEYHAMRNGKAATFSVLRDWRYLFFRATFGYKGKAPHSSEELRGLLEQAEGILQGKELVAKEAVEALGPPGSNVDQQIEHMKEFRFFNSWLRSGAGDVQRVLDELDKAHILDSQLRQTVEELRSEEVLEKFEEAQETVRLNFERSVGTYHRATKLLGAIDNRIRKISLWLKERHRTDFDIKDDMMLILGLFRFPFPEDAYRKIDVTLNHLTGAGREEAEKRKQIEAQKQVFSALYEIELGQQETTKLAFVLGMLWATELDQEIIGIARRRQVLPPAAANSTLATRTAWPVSFSLVVAAALVRDSEEKRLSLAQEDEGDASGAHRQAEQIKEAYQLLKNIAMAYGKISEGEEKSKLAVGIAYLDFHILTALCSPKLSPLLEPDLGEGISPLGLLADAIEKARSASVKTSGLDDRLKTYALNQLLYYLAEGVLRGVQRFDVFQQQLDEAGLKLLELKGDPGWHYRYDDSLARYFEVVGNARNHRQSWERGRSHVEKARSNCFDDPLIVGSSTPGGQESKGYYREFIERYEAWKLEHPDSQ